MTLDLESKLQHCKDKPYANNSQLNYAFNTELEETVLQAGRSALRRQVCKECELILLVEASYQ